MTLRAIQRCTDYYRGKHGAQRADEARSSDTNNHETSITSVEQIVTGYKMSSAIFSPLPSISQQTDLAPKLDLDVSLWDIARRTLQMQGRLFVGPAKIPGVNNNLNIDVQSLDVYDRKFLPRLYKVFTFVQKVHSTKTIKGELTSRFLPDIPLKWPDCIKQQEKLKDLQWAAEGVSARGRVLLAFVLEARSAMWKENLAAVESYVEMIGHDDTLYECLTRILMVCQPLSSLRRNTRERRV